ncbi:Stf0 family sulfotransferase [Paracoccus jeotgali]|uniref:Sulphotransferase Stf0 domain-containing protein n=1 Tax=Paracoccus jeotgali TaxID=2065379 RepID=A0A2K9MHA2_9RHOB|nr:Stf0 family sulfotransferase [Paracoccus jeotgali]AUM74990.1 hypothetical protein CYR75_12500 [Paracoccus jeotgali]
MRTTDFLIKGNVHETGIASHFQGRTRYRVDTPLFPTPLTVLLFTNRCGSNLFGDYLRGTGRIAGLTESLNHQEVVRRATASGIANYPDYFASQVNEALQDGPTHYGVKASAGQLAMLQRWNITGMFNGLVVLRVVRENLLAQAVSMLIASQTGKWASFVTGADKAPPEYDFDGIVKWLNRFNQENGAGQLLTASLGVPHLTVTYEVFRDDPLPWVQSALRLLGQDVDGVTVAPPSLSKQADATNHAFRERFRADLVERMRGGGPELGLI